MSCNSVKLIPENRDGEGSLRISIIDKLFIFCFSLLVSMSSIKPIKFFFIRCRIEILHQPSLSILSVLSLFFGLYKYIDISEFLF